MAISNDNNMSWDYTIHFYVPSNELFVKKLGKNLELELGYETDGVTESLNYREELAHFIKDFCIAQSNTDNERDERNRIEFLLFQNLDDERYDLQRAYVEMVNYAFNNEGDMVGRQTGINVIKGQITPIRELRGNRELSSRLERILRNSGLLYKGYRNWEVPDEYERGSDF